MHEGAAEERRRLGARRTPRPTAPSRPASAHPAAARDPASPAGTSPSNSTRTAGRRARAPRPSGSDERRHRTIAATALTPRQLAAAAPSPCRSARRAAAAPRRRAPARTTRIHERDPLGALRVRQMLEVRVGALRPPEDLLRRRAARRSTSGTRRSRREAATRDAPSARRRRSVRNSATKPAVAGSPSDERPPIVNAVAMPGIIVPKPPIVEDRARVRLLVDEADEREEQAGHDAVREHLEHRAVQTRARSASPRRASRRPCARPTSRR